MDGVSVTSESTSEADVPAAVVYTHSLLARSMTFIRSHAEALRRYRPIYAGAHRVSGLELEADRAFAVNNGSLLGAGREYLFRRFGWAPAFVETLRARKPGVVHAHFGTSGPAGLRLATQLAVPLVVTFHGRDATIRADAGQSRRARELIRGKQALISSASAIIAVSSYVQRQLVEQGYPAELVILHRNGIDLEYFRPDERRRGAEILFVGRFVEKKGVEYLIEAARILRTAGREFSLVLVGDGPLRATLEEAALKANVRTKFTGFLPLEEVRERINRATVVAVPSVTAADGDKEGLPTVILEAQAMKTPIVATRHSGIPEGVLEGKTAELVDERDASALAAAAASFLESPEKQREFGAAGRRFVGENFDLRGQVDGLEALYNRVREEFARKGAQ